MAEPQADDHDLIQRYLKGDAGAFDELYARYRRPIYGFLCQQLSGKSAHVDDVFQQTWIKAIEALPRYQHSERFLSWLFRIAHNLAIDTHRRGAWIDDTADANHLADRQPASAEDEPWTQLADSELQATLQKAIASLPDAQREVILLRQQDVPFKDIAVIQGSNLNTVLGRMHYAVNALRRQLAALR